MEKSVEGQTKTAHSIGIFELMRNSEKCTEQDVRVSEIHTFVNRKTLKDCRNMIDSERRMTPEHLQNIAEPETQMESDFEILLSVMRRFDEDSELADLKGPAVDAKHQELQYL